MRRALPRIGVGIQLVESITRCRDQGIARSTCLHGPFMLLVKILVAYEPLLTWVVILRAFNCWMKMKMLCLWS